jgi:hypothetical protein
MQASAVDHFDRVRVRGLPFDFCFASEATGYMRLRANQFTP